MAARHRRLRAEAPKPTWLVTIKAAPPAPDAARRSARSPILLSPWVWQKVQNDKKGMAVGGDRGDTGGVPASPRIGCMGQVKGARRCSRARGPASRGPAASGLPCSGSLAGLLMGLFGRRTGRKSTAYSKVRDVPSDSSSSSSSGSARGARAPRPFDPPLPVQVVRRPAVEENGPSLWERRRGSAKVLEGLQLT